MCIPVNLIRNILVAVVVLWCVSTRVGFAAAPDKPFFRQEESAQHMVLRQGERFRFFQHNLISTNWSMAKYDQDIKVDDQLSLHINDDSIEGETMFRWHHPLLVAPFTEYEMSFQLKAEQAQGPAPHLVVELCDIRRDTRDYFSVDMLDTDQLPDGWVTFKHRFTTPRDIHYLKVYFRSARQGTCRIWLDQVYLTQISPPQALRPQSRTLLQPDMLVLDTDTGITQRLLPLTEIADSEKWIRLRGDLQWNKFAGRATLTINWLDDSAGKIAQDVISLERTLGVEPTWNGMRTRHERFGAAGPPVSRWSEIYFDTKPQQGGVAIDYEWDVPAGARTAVVEFAAGNSYAGQMSWKDVILVVEP